MQGLGEMAAVFHSLPPHLCSQEKEGVTSSKQDSVVSPKACDPSQLLC